MIIYGTKQTIERLKLDTSTNEAIEELYRRQKNDRLHEWGARLFYLSGRKCLQVANFASKFTLFLFDIKVSDVENIPHMIMHYLGYIYDGDFPMMRALVRYAEETRYFCFGKLTDKSIISTLNRNHLYFADEGYYFYNFVDENGILDTHEINTRFNRKYLLTIKRPNQKQPEYIYPAEEFRRLIMERYGAPNSNNRPNINITV